MMRSMKRTLLLLLCLNPVAACNSTPGTARTIATPTVAPVPVATSPSAPTPTQTMTVIQTATFTPTLLPVPRFTVGNRPFEFLGAFIPVKEEQRPLLLTD